MNPPEQIHPYIPKAMDSLKQGRISRREFLRLATLLGVSFATAQLLSGCSPPSAATSTAGIKRGGKLKIGWPVGSPTDLDTNVLRQIYEHLTLTDKDNISYAYLLERWQPNEDLTEWTLILRQGIQWSNGEDFIAEDVEQTIRNRLIDWGVFEDYLTPDGVELVDDHTVKLSLERAKLDIPEILSSNFAFISHREEIDANPFDGMKLGTGPFKLDTFEEGIARLVSRDGYWQTGEDGDLLPYLEAIEFIDFGSETELRDAFLAGEIDASYPLARGYLEMRDDPGFETQSVLTNWTNVLRFRVDLEPWSDNRVRSAVKKLQDRQEILNRAYGGEGELGYDTHVSPGHPEFSPMEVPPYDPDGARALLQQAGAEDLAFTIDVIDDTESVAYALQLQEDARAAGVDITVNKMTEEEYFAIWLTTPVGITNWHHRELAVQVLPLAYTADASGNPVPWNESHWVDEEFSELLAQAQVTLDLEARRAIMADLQQIQSERGSIGIPYWKNIWSVANRAFRDLEPHPRAIYHLTRTWYDPDLDLFA